MEILSMYDLKEGQSGKITEVDCKSDIKRRLMELGIIKGSLVKCVLSAPFNSIKAYSVMGSVIAVREADARRVTVQEVEL
ncbi:MAG: ferrous iron transport protein A [Clostridia bacterium]|nr:ferrous iron transport protein A [Clostridia bacterium]